MPTTKIHLLTITRMGILIVYHNRLWQFRVLSSDGAIYGHTSRYYTSEAAEKAGREWVGAEKR
ncbi:MAG TPA: hypothetical protein V6D14_17565 [Coleofasciculaceae cyanobacterium]|jgi:hypothetical protein